MVTRRQFLAGGSFVVGSVLATRLLGCAEGATVDGSAAGGGSGAETPWPGSRSDAEWRDLLSDEEYEVLRDHGTERAYTSDLLDEDRDGTYACAGCGLDLFAAATKYDSATGWPSFTEPLPDAISTSEDRSLDMVRTALACSRCDSHLGHVFDDGPPPTGQRYCINGISLAFRPVPA